MALGPADLEILVAAMSRFRPRPDPIRVLSLGYPDLLIGAAEFDKLLGTGAAASLPIRKDSSGIAEAHHYAPGATHGVFESVAAFAALGAQLICVDNIPHTGTEIYLDLNEPVPEEHQGSFEMILDPGTIEHCFNIGQTMKNITLMAKVGGLVFHHSPLNMVNHGFYSISPTFFADYFSLNGFAIELMKIWEVDARGQRSLRELPPYDRPYLRDETTCLVLASKLRECDVRWPIQTAYSDPKRRELRTEPSGRLIPEVARAQFEQTHRKRLARFTGEEPR